MNLKGTISIYFIEHILKIYLLPFLKLCVVRCIKKVTIFKDILSKYLICKYDEACMVYNIDILESALSHEVFHA